MNTCSITIYVPHVLRWRLSLLDIVCVTFMIVFVKFDSVALKIISNFKTPWCGKFHRIICYIHAVI